MFKKLLLVMSLLFTFSCEDNIVVDEETSMKLWLDGVEVDVELTVKKLNILLTMVIHILKRYSLSTFKKKVVELNWIKNTTP